MKTKIFLRLATVVVFACFVTVFASCSDDDKGLAKSELVGTWESRSATYVFNKNGTGYDIHNTDEYNYFEWSANDMQIVFIYEPNNNKSGFPVRTAVTNYYTIVGNVLTLYYSDWELEGTFYKK